MNRRGPRAALAAPIRAARSSGFAFVYRSASGACTRNIVGLPPPPESPDSRPAGTAWSPIRGVVGLGADMSPETRPALCTNPTWVRHARGMPLQRPPAGTIPDAPGSYQFKDADGRVVYVGKAKSLRSRLSNYFQSPSALPPRTAQMVASAETVEWIQVRNDVEALMLGYWLVKEHGPRVNVR